MVINNSGNILCACGCGRPVVNLCNTFIHGHSGYKIMKGTVPWNSGKKIDVSKYVSYGMKDKHHSSVTRARLRDCHIGRQLTLAQRMKISIANRGKKCTMETRRRISSALRKPKILIICKMCNKIIYVKPSNSTARFCSLGCRAAYCNPRCRKKNTQIENALQQWLTSRGIIFKTEYPIKLKSYSTRVDIFISPNICVYADGDYWHSLSSYIVRDNQQNIELADLGYVVVRLQERAIKSGDFSKLAAVIKEQQIHNSIAIPLLATIGENYERKNTGY